jgi:hypothetical protein
LKRTAGIALAIAVMAAAVIAPAAGAHTVKYDSTVTAKLKKGGKDANTFSGVVDSTKAKCVMNRTVDVYLRVDNADDSLIGSDATSDLGEWEIIPAGELAPGTYYATAPKTVLKKNKKHRHVCKRATSKDVTVK